MPSIVPGEGKAQSTKNCWVFKALLWPLCGEWTTVGSVELGSCQGNIPAVALTQLVAGAGGRGGVGFWIFLTAHPTGFDNGLGDGVGERQGLSPWSPGRTEMPFTY